MHGRHLAVKGNEHMLKSQDAAETSSLGSMRKHSEWAVACQLMALLTELRVSELMPECAWQVVAVVVFCLWQLFLLTFYGFVFTSRRYKSNTNNRRSILLLLYVIREMWRPPQSPGSMSSQLTICSHCMQTAFRFLLESLRNALGSFSLSWT